MSTLGGVVGGIAAMCIVAGLYHAGIDVGFLGGFGIGMILAFIGFNVGER